MMKRPRKLSPLPPPPQQKKKMMKRPRKLSPLLGDTLESCVLPRLPVKSLIRFKCVSHRWYNLVSPNNRFFALQQYHYQNSSQLHSLNVEGFSDIFDRRPISRSILRDRSSVSFCNLLPYSRGFLIAAVSNGLVLMACNMVKKVELFVGNPLYQDWKWIQTRIRVPDKSRFGLAFDPVAAHYRIVFPCHNPDSLDLNLCSKDDVFNHVDDPLEHPDEYGFQAIGEHDYELVLDHLPNNIPEQEFDGPHLFNNHHPEHEYGFVVFSSETGKWEVSRSKLMLQFHDLFADPVSLSGILYWKMEDDLMRKGSVLWYDTEKDCSGQIPLPKVGGGLYYDSNGGSILNESNGSITYTRIVHVDLEVWSLKDKFQWSKSHHIRIGEIVDRKPQLFASFNNWNKTQHGHGNDDDNDEDDVEKDIIADVFPIGFDGKVVFCTTNGATPLSYDVETGEVTRYPALSLLISEWYLYKASLIPTPGRNSWEFPPGWKRLQTNEEGYIHFKCAYGVLKVSTGDYQL